MKNVELSSELQDLLKSRIIGEMGDDGTFFKGETGQGFVYKNPLAFETHDGICYIPELGFEGETEMKFKPDVNDLNDRSHCYNYYDFLRIAKGNESLARNLFDIVDWQCPETLFNEWENHGHLDEYDLPDED